MGRLPIGDRLNLRAPDGRTFSVGKVEAARQWEGIAKGKGVRRKAESGESRIQGPKIPEWANPSGGAGEDVGAVFEQHPDGVRLRGAEVFGRDAESDFRDSDIILTDSFIELKDKDDFILTAKMDHTPEQLRKNLIMKTVYDILQSEKQVYAAFT